MPQNSRLSPSSYRPGATEIRDYAFDLAGMASADRRSTLFGERPPNSGDDVDSGFRKGSIWIYNDRAFFCTDSVPGDATWVEIGLGNQTPYTVILGGSSLNPAAGGQTYYAGQSFDLAPLSSPANRAFAIAISGTIVAVSYNIVVSGTAAGGQGTNGKLALLNVFTSQQTDLLLNQTYNLPTNVGFQQNLNVPVLAGQSYSIALVTPTFTTAPTTVRHQVTLYIRPSVS